MYSYVVNVFSKTCVYRCGLYTEMSFVNAAVTVQFSPRQTIKYHSSPTGHVAATLTAMSATTDKL